VRLTIVSRARLWFECRNPGSKRFRSALKPEQGLFYLHLNTPITGLKEVHQDTLKEIIEETAGLLRDRFLGKIFQLSESSFAIDFGLKGDGYLFISTDPSSPRLYLIKRSVRELEKQSVSLSHFGQYLRANLGGGKVLSITKEADERVVRLSFTVADELGDNATCELVAQLTGRSANLFLLDGSGRITHALRAPRGSGQQIGEQYRPPTIQPKQHSEESRFTRGLFPTLSEAADEYYRQLASKNEFDNLAATLSAHLRKEISKLKKLKANLEKDTIAHGNPDDHRRLGDLLLANIANAVRDANKVKLTDYYAEGAPTIEVEIDEKTSLQDAAGEAFSRYSKSRRAVEEIGTRLIQLERDLRKVEEKRARLERAIADRDLTALAALDQPKDKKAFAGTKQKASTAIPGMRRYRSSDGYEVIVGRSARDNDQLTFRVARPYDLWLHAGDYPGSHVIVRNSSRNEIPHRTIIEAAQLAAKFSQAATDSKVTIHYTQRKFLTKPKGAAPGLVRMSSFRSVTVEPGETMERL
jgi:predicted ribosome quality control (RQC) complex YloA/Tae2 family protein